MERSIFDKTGRIKFPDKTRTPIAEEAEEKKFINKCYCGKGHNLVSERVRFNDHYGIMVLIRNKEKNGLLGISPKCGCKMKISMDIDLVAGETYSFHCTECDENLPVFSPCPDCDGHLVTLFLDETLDYKYCIGICNRMGCCYSEIRTGDELVTCNSADITRY